MDTGLVGKESGDFRKGGGVLENKELCDLREDSEIFKRYPPNGRITLRALNVEIVKEINIGSDNEEFIEEFLRFLRIVGKMSSGGLHRRNGGNQEIMITLAMRKCRIRDLRTCQNRKRL